MAQRALAHNDSANSFAEALTKKMASQHLDIESHSSAPLDLTVMGLYTGAALNGVECVVLRAQQSNATDPRHISILGVSHMIASTNGLHSLH